MAKNLFLKNDALAVHDRDRDHENDRTHECAHGRECDGDRESLVRSLLLIYWTLLASSLDLIRLNKRTCIVTPCITFICNNICKILVVQLVFKRNHSCRLLPIKHTINVECNWTDSNRIAF